MPLELAFKSDEFSRIDIARGEDWVSIQQDDDAVLLSLTDLPRFIHELKIVENEGNKID
jgi:hypothetical protein